MRFKTVLNCYKVACTIHGELLSTDEHYLTKYQRKKIPTLSRQRDAFRARLVEMYRERDATQEDDAGVKQLCRAVQEFAKKKGLKDYYIGVQLEANDEI